MRRSARICRWPALISIAAGLLVVLCGPGPVRARKPKVMEVKPAVIGKIAEFVRWPRTAGLDEPDRPFEFVILGDTPLEPHLLRYYEHVRIAGHRVYLRRAQQITDVGRPHLLFISASFEERLEEILARLGTAPVLTVADTRGFAHRGVAVNLVISEDQIRFEVSRRALQRHQLTASYHVLALARLVDDQQALR